MKRLALALTLFGTALGANAALFLRADSEGEAVQGTSWVTLGSQTIEVPRALIRDRAQMAGGRLDRLDISVNAGDFTPLPQPSIKDTSQPVPERLSVILTATSAGADPTELFQTVYARFLSRETWSNPGGLVMRRFRAGTPYEDRELYIGAGGRRIFIALCPQDSEREIEPCTTMMRQDGLTVEVRFNARYLPEWRRITGAALAMVTNFRPAEAATPQP